jgi:deoxyribose-phosphate aldolase
VNEAEIIRITNRRRVAITRLYVLLSERGDSLSAASHAAVEAAIRMNEDFVKMSTGWLEAQQR